MNNISFDKERNAYEKLNFIFEIFYLIGFYFVRGVILYMIIKISFSNLFFIVTYNRY